MCWLKKSLSLFWWQKYRKRENLKIFKPPPADRSSLLWAAPQTRHAQSYTKMCSGSIWRKKQFFWLHMGVKPCTLRLKSLLSHQFILFHLVGFFPFLFFKYDSTDLIWKDLWFPKVSPRGLVFKVWKWNLDEQMRWRSLVPFEMIWVPIG